MSVVSGLLSGHLLFPASQTTTDLKFLPQRTVFSLLALLQDILRREVLLGDLFQQLTDGHPKILWVTVKL